MASMSFRKKELLGSLVSEALDIEDAFVEQQKAVLAVPVKSVLTYLRACVADIRVSFF